MVYKGVAVSKEVARLLVFFWACSEWKSRPKGFTNTMNNMIVDGKIWALDQNPAAQIYDAISKIYDGCTEINQALDALECFWD